MNESGLLPLRLTAIRWAADGINLYELSNVTTEPLPVYEPGAHIEIQLPGGHARQYSLARPYRPADPYLVGVKLDGNSRGGSDFLHRSARVGDVYRVGHPRNNFPLAETAQHSVLIAGGIGITPVLCMAAHLNECAASFDVHYAVRTRAEAAFVEELKRIAPNANVHIDEEAGALLDVDGFVRQAPSGTHVYCCGPAPMLAAFNAATAHLPSEQVHLEYFSAPDLAPLESGFTLVLAQSGRELQVEANSTILETLRAADIDVPASCEQGVCGACETQVLSGVPDHRDCLLSEAEKAAGRSMMICCSGSLTDRLVLDL